MKILLAIVIGFVLSEVLPIVNEILTYLTPLIVLGVGYLVTLFRPLIPGWAMLLVITTLSTVLTFVSQLFENPSLKWWQQLIYGFLAIVIQQFVKQFGSEKREKDNEQAKFKKAA